MFNIYYSIRLQLQSEGSQRHINRFNNIILKAAVLAFCSPSCRMAVACLLQYVVAGALSTLMFQRFFCLIFVKKKTICAFPLKLQIRQFTLI